MSNSINLKQSEISTAVLFLTDSHCHHFPVKNCRYCQDQKMLVLGHPLRWGHFTHSPFLSAFLINSAILMGIFHGSDYLLLKTFLLLTARRHFHILISQKPTQPKALVFSWHVAEWAVRSFLSIRIPLCQKLMGLVFASLTERIHRTIWALLAQWGLASSY